MNERQTEPKATVYGILLLLLLVAYVFFQGRITDPIVDFTVKAFVGIVNLGMLFYGQSVVKKLNRNYIPWAVALFFLTPFALIVLGQLPKLHTVIVLDYIMEEQKLNPNNLQTIYLRTGSSELPEALMNDTFTLQHLLVNYHDYLKDYTRMFPVAVAYELNRRNVVLSAEQMAKLDQFARENGQTNFMNLVGEIRTLAPWEMIEKYK